MYDSGYYGTMRLAVSFGVALTLHSVFIGFMQVSTVSRSRQETMITDVELLRKEIPFTQQLVVSAPDAAQSGNAGFEPEKPAPGVQRTAASDAPLDLRREAVRASVPGPIMDDRLVDRSGSVTRPSTNALDDLVQAKGTAANEIADIRGGARQTQGAFAGERFIFEKEAPLRRAVPADAPDMIAEVGAQRTRTIADLPSSTAPKSAPAAAVRKNLLQQKEAMKRQLASLGTQPGTDERALSRPAHQFSEMVAAPAGRDRASGLAEIEGSGSSSGAVRESASQRSSSRLPGTSEAGAAAATGVGTVAKDYVPAPAQRPSAEQFPVRKPLTAEAVSRIAGRSAAVMPAAEASQPPVTISGPLEKRKIVTSSVPRFPEWARKKSIEANVALKFFVTPEGTVTPDVSVMQTSGFMELDTLCKEHIRKWLFEPLPPGGDRQNQWGIITMRFKLE